MQQAKGELKNSLLADIVRMVKGRSRFAIFSHAEPDGDAIGSQIALTLALRQLGKQVVSLRLDSVPDALAFLNIHGAIDKYDPGRDREGIGMAEVIIVVDSCGYRRLGALGDEVEKSESEIINIDHHRDNDFFGNVNFVRFEAGGAAELVSEVIRALGVPLKGAIAEAIYVGISTDTLGFKYIDPEGNLIGIVSELIRGGINIESLQEKLYYQNPRSFLDDLTGLLTSVRYGNGGSFAWFAMPSFGRLTYYQRDLARETLQHLLSMKHIRAAAMLHEGVGGTEVWLRSKTEVDVGRVAEKIGGGGHRTASGALMRDIALEEARDIVLKHLATAVKG